MSEIEGGNVRGRPPVKWRDRVQEYVRERGEGSLRNLEQARRVCQDRERWKEKKVLSQNGFFFFFFLIINACLLQVIIQLTRKTTDEM